MLANKIKHIIKQILPVTWIRYRKFESTLWMEYREKMLNEAMILCNNDTSIINSYVKDLDHYHIAFSEWCTFYDFKDKSGSYKRDFLTRYNAWKLYRKFITPSIRNLFYNKGEFLKYFSKDLSRKWILPPSNVHDKYFNEYVNSLKSITAEVDVIVKPMEGSLGDGIYKLKKGTIKDPISFANEAIKNNLLIEECIQGCDELQVFNPWSLNTLRIWTTWQGEIWGSFIRFGIGDTVVDNAHNGGIWCRIDVDKGEIVSDAVSSRGDKYEQHPVSEVKFYGTKIPLWEECCKKVIKMHKEIDLPFVGWDVCVTKHGDIEIIEGNHAPDIDVMQYPPRKGLRKEFEEIIRQFKKYLKESGKIQNYPWAKF